MKKQMKQKMISMVLVMIVVLASAFSVSAASVSKTVYTSCTGATSANFVSFKHTVTKSDAGDALTFVTEANSTSAYTTLYHIRYQAQVLIKMKNSSADKTYYALYDLDKTYDISQATGAVLPYTLNIRANSYVKTVDGETYRGEEIVWAGNIKATVILKDGRTATGEIDSLD